MPVIDLNITKRTMSRIQDPRKALLAIGEILTSDIIKNWNKGLGSDGNPMKGLSNSYLKEKEESGRKGIPDFNYTGQLQQSMKSTVKKDNKAVIISAAPTKRVSENKGFKGKLKSVFGGGLTNQKLLYYLTLDRPNAFEITQKMKEKARRILEKYLSPNNPSGSTEV